MADKDQVTDVTIIPGSNAQNNPDLAKKSPLEATSSVTSVTRNKRNSNNGAYRYISVRELFGEAGQKDHIELYLLDPEHNLATAQEIADACGFSPDNFRPYNQRLEDDGTPLRQEKIAGVTHYGLTEDRRLALQEQVDARIRERQQEAEDALKLRDKRDLHAALLEFVASRQEDGPVWVPYQELLRELSPDQSAALLDDWVRVRQALEDAQAQVYLDFSGFAEEQTEAFRPFNQLSEEEYGRVVVVRGEIVSRTDRYAITHAVKYRCWSCERIVTIRQTGQKIQKPPSCQCQTGKENTSRTTSNVLDTVDVAEIALLLEELGDSLHYQDQTPQRLRCTLTKPYYSSDLDGKLGEGVSIECVGYLEAEDNYRKNQQLRQRERRFRILHPRPLSDTEILPQPTEEDLAAYEKIKQLPIDARLQALGAVVGDGVAGYEDVKKVLAVQLFTGTGWDGSDRRDKIDVALIGPPGTGKSTLANQAAKLHRKAFVLGKATTKAALDGPALTDPTTGRYRASRGVLSRANGGGCVAAHELNLLNQEVREALLEPMEEGKITIAKANVYSSVDADAQFIATMNPKKDQHMVLTQHKGIHDLVEVHQRLVDRFNLILPVPEIRDADAIRSITRRVVSGMDAPAMAADDGLLLSAERLRIIALYAKNLLPIGSMKITTDAEEAISKLYQELREHASLLTLTARDLVTIRNLAAGIARTELSDTVTEEHITAAYKLKVREQELWLMHQEGRV